MERRLAAILAAGGVSYARLMRADEAGRLHRLTALGGGFLEPLIAAISTVSELRTASQRTT